MKNILFILYFIIYSCTPAFGAATTTITADSIRSSNRTKTWTPPSITDVLAGLTDVQTLTNKTLTSPTINTPLVDVDTFTEQGSTPSTPAAGKRKVYAKADGIYHLDSAGNERKVGSGSGGGDVSFITNGNADDANASIFIPYADAAATRPVDGTGGSPTVTTSITSTVPLVGTKSYLLTKPASNVQGQGWAIPFTVDLGYRAKASKITVQYIVNSGTFVAGSDSAESDVIWYLYDVTNSVLIEPSNIKMRASNTSISDQYEAEFQTSATGSSYRLIAHVQSVSALAYELKVDEIKVSPNKALYGVPATAFQTVASPPTIIGSTSGSLSIGTGGGAYYTMEYARVGEEVIVRYNIRVGTTGAVDAVGAYILPPPPGITVSSTIKDYDAVGYGDISSTASANPVARLTVKRYAASAGFILDHTDAAILGNSHGLLFNNTNVFSAVARFKVQGQSSSQRISDGYDGRLIAASYYGHSSPSIADNVYHTILFNTKVEDSAGMYSSGTVTIPSAGLYQIDASVAFIIGGYVGNNIFNFRARVNGATDYFLDRLIFLNSLQPNILKGSIRLSLKAGDTIVFQGMKTNFGGNSGLDTDLTQTRFSVVKVQSPQSISASDSVSVSAYKSTAQTTTTTVYTTVSSYTSKEDTHNAFNLTTGLFTCPIAGKYLVAINTSFVANATGVRHNVIIKNGAVYQFGVLQSASVSDGSILSTTAIVSCIAGDTIGQQAYQTSGGNLDIRALGGATSIHITKIGN